MNRWAILVLALFSLVLTTDAQVQDQPSAHAAAPAATGQPARPLVSKDPARLPAAQRAMTLRARKPESLFVALSQIPGLSLMAELQDVTVSTESTSTALVSGAPAASLVSNALQSLGWLRAPNLPSLDVAAAGTLTYFGPDGSSSTPVPVTIKCRGSRQYRIDADDQNGRRTAIVNDLGGVDISPEGKGRRLSSSAAVSMRAPFFPFLLDSLNPNDPRSSFDVSVPVQAVGVSQRIHATLAPGEDKVSRLRSRASELTLWFGGSQAPARIDFVRVAADNHYVTVPFSLLVSDYRSVGGVLVAFRQEEQLDGQTVYVLVLQSVQLGPEAGVSDSDFAVPATAMGGGQ